MRKRYKLGIIGTILYIFSIGLSDYAANNIAEEIFTGVLIVLGFPIVITYFGLSYALTLNGLHKLIAIAISIALLPLLIVINYLLLQLT